MSESVSCKLNVASYAAPDVQVFAVNLKMCLLQDSLGDGTGTTDPLNPGVDC